MDCWLPAPLGAAALDYGWFECCDQKRARGRLRTGNWRCWSGGGASYEQCCALWPDNRNQEHIPLYDEPEVLFGLSDGGILSVFQTRQASKFVDAVALDGLDLTNRRHPVWVGGLLWQPGALVARWMEGPCAGPLTWQGLRVLELAAGVGLPAVVAAHYGANVTATDASRYSLWALRRNLRNVTQSRSVPSRGRTVRKRHRALRLDVWDYTELRRFAAAQGPFDALLLAGMDAVSADGQYSPGEQVNFWQGVASLLGGACGRDAFAAVYTRVDNLELLEDWGRGRGALAGTGVAASLAVAARGPSVRDPGGHAGALAILRRTKRLGPRDSYCIVRDDVADLLRRGGAGCWVGGESWADD